MGISKSGRYRKIEPGTVRGRLTLMRELPDQDRFGRYFVECLCACGKITKTRKHAFLNGYTTSCGCAQRESTKITGSKRRGPPGWANFTTVFYHYQRGAVRRGLAFKLTRDFFWNETKKPCFYCGAVPSNVEAAPGKFGEYHYNGLDRVDNTKGYLRSNVVPCCRACNRAKWKMTAEEFLKLANRIARLHPVQP